MQDPSHITLLLRQIGKGDKQSVDSLFPLVYDELRRRAKEYMGQQDSGHTLQPTALVNDAYIKLVAQDQAAYANREHFFNCAAMAMRQILVDHARRKKAAVRGGGAKRVEMADFDSTVPADQLDWEELDRALARLEREDERRHRVVMLRYFAGLEESQIAQMLGVSTKTIQRDWKVSRMFLLAELSAGKLRQ